MQDQVYITECPRDAMQGLHQFIPTADKIRYLKQLLSTGFDCIDAGSFVNPRVIPQLKDTPEVFEAITPFKNHTRILAIIPNLQGAENACRFDMVDDLGFPFSVSETFLQRNINSNSQDSLKRIGTIQEIAEKHGKSLVVYISMAFGNPYNDPWNAEIVADATRNLVKMGVRSIALSDTIGEADTESISYLFTNLLPEFPDIQIGAHLHTTPQNWRENVNAAFMAGCRKFDGAIKGLGGCPMAKNELTGNLPTENLLAYLDTTQATYKVNKEAFASSMLMAGEIFPL